MMTDEQMRIYEERMEYWRAQRWSTEPLDHAAATGVICTLYRVLGKPRPKVLFFSSPAMCVLAGRSLFGRRDWPGWLWPRLKMQLWDQFPVEFSDHWGRDLRMGGDQLLEIEQLLGRQVEARLFEHAAHMTGGRPPEELERLESLLEREMSGQDGADVQAGGELGAQLEHLGSGLSDWMNSRPAGKLRGGKYVVFAELERRRERLRENCCTPGGLDWLPLHDYLDRAAVRYSPRLQDLLHLWIHQSQHCHWWFPFNGIVLASERPCTVRLDERGQPHSESGAAIEYRDGLSLHALHGVAVEPRVVSDPATITLEDVAGESDPAARRLVIECYGWKRYMLECDAEVIDSVPEDHPIRGLRGARLIRKELPGESEPNVFLDMVDSTGAGQRYLERIDPNAYNGDAGRLCHAAMASRWRYRDDHGELRRTFPRWQDYQPIAES